MEVSNKLEHLEQEGSNNRGIKKNWSTWNKRVLVMEVSNKLEHLEQEGGNNGVIK